MKMGGNQFVLQCRIFTSYQTIVIYIYMSLSYWIKFINLNIAVMQKNKIYEFFRDLQTSLIFNTINVHQSGVLQEIVWRLSDQKVSITSLYFLIAFRGCVSDQLYVFSIYSGESRQNTLRACCTVLRFLIHIENSGWCQVCFSSLRIRFLTHLSSMIELYFHAVDI